MKQDSVRVRDPRLQPLACRLVAPDALATPRGEFALAAVHYGSVRPHPGAPGSSPALLSSAGRAGLEPGAPGGSSLRIDVPLVQLQAPLVELWTSTSRPELRREGALRLACTDELVFGALEVEEQDLEADVGRAYDLLLDCLAASPHRHLLRMWNVIPRVGRLARGRASIDGSIDRYMQFCRARSLAFERHHGATFEERLSAASAVGSDGGPIVVYFLASRTPGLRSSNPRQEEPWRYPERYGPRSPSFARAMRAPAPFERTLFVSGTASIVGHASRHKDDVRAQVDETLRNLEEVARSSGISERGRDWFLKIYLRDAEDVESVHARLSDAFGAQTPMLFLRADVCRPELALEIEGVLTSA